MKDYSLNIEDSKTFILNYKIKDDQIIINFASGKEYTIPYTLENEKKLLKRMKEQVLNSEGCELKQAKKFLLERDMVMFYAIFILFNIFTFQVSTTVLICSILLIMASVGSIYQMVNSKKIIKDIKKNKLFLENQELLNEKINQNTLSNTNNKTQELVSSVVNNEKTFNINNTDKLKYGQLKIILNNIELDKQFGFDYSVSQEVKPKELTKTRR